VLQNIFVVIEASDLMAIDFRVLFERFHTAMHTPPEIGTAVG
jgi:hypothetical protein